MHRKCTRNKTGTSSASGKSIISKLTPCDTTAFPFRVKGHFYRGSQATTAISCSCLIHTENDHLSTLQVFTFDQELADCNSGWFDAWVVGCNAEHTVLIWSKVVGRNAGGLVIVTQCRDDFCSNLTVVVQKQFGSDVFWSEDMSALKTMQIMSRFG